MAKMFYSADEAKAKLACDESTLKQAVRDGRLREFRDAGSVNYKVEEIDKLAASGELSGGSPGGGGGPAEGGSPAGDEASDMSASMGPIGLADTGESSGMSDSGGGSGAIDLGATGGATSFELADTSADATAPDASAAGKSGTQPSESGEGAPGDIGLSPDQSGIDLAASGGDIVSLDEDDAADATSAPKKDDTVVSSVGVSVFDEEDIDDEADPMAKTVMSGESGAGGTGLEGVGSGGSGLLDLTRESDDTSLGAELLDEIYPGEESGTVEMGEATRAGLEGAVDETPAEPAEILEGEPEVEAAGVAGAAAAPRPAARTRAVVEHAPDAFSYGTSGLVAVALIVMCFAGLAIASMVRGVWPSILSFVFAKLWMFGLGALLVAGIAMGIGVFLGRRSESA